MKTISETLFYIGVILALVGGVFLAATINTPTAEAWGSTCGSCGSDSKEGGGSFSWGGNDDPDPVRGCTDPAASNHNPRADRDNGSCEYPEPVVTSCHISASANEVDYNGSVTLMWETEGFDTITVNGETVAANGEMLIENITDNGSYVLSATNANGDTCHTEVDVACNAPEIIRECELTVEKNADKEAVVPGEEITYTIHVENTGDANCTGGGVKIFDHLSEKLEFVSFTKGDNVQGGYHNKPVYDAANDHTVRFNGSTIEPGELAEMTVTARVKTPEQCGDYVIENTAKATARELNNFSDWSYSNTVKTDVDNDCEVEVPGCTDMHALNYNAEATTDNGSCEYPETPAPTCEFYPTDTSIVRGETTNLNWTTTNAERVVLSGGTGDVALNGSLPVTPLATYLYRLTAFGEGEVDCETTITVTNPEDPEVPGCTDVDATNYDADATTDDGSCEYPEDPEVPGCTDNDATNYDADATVDDGSCEYPTNTGGGGSSSPRCELEISDASIESGEAVTLTWETSRATEVTITDDRGNVVMTTDKYLAKDKEEFYDGEMTITPSRDTEYTLLAERGRRDRECSVEVEVEAEEIVILEVRDQQPLVAGISLTSVPHTGFEAGPIVTTLFYTLLIAWALFMTYVLVIPKAAVQTVTAATAPVVTAAQQMKEAEALRPDVFANVASTPVAASVAAPVAAAPANLPVAPVAPIATPVAAAPTTMAATVSPKVPVEVAALEAIAHNHQALLSSDAMTTFIAAVPAAQQLTKIIDVVNTAKTQFPLEDGWVVINNDRMLALLVA